MPNIFAFKIMSKRSGGAKTVQKQISENTTKKRKSSSDEKQKSPLRVAVPPPAVVASPASASQSESEDSGDLELPEKTAQPKKVLNFRNHFPESAIHSFPTRRSSDLDRKSVV